MDDLEEEETWIHDVFSALRGETHIPRVIQDWLDEFENSLRASRLKHPMIDSIAIRLVSGLAQQRSLFNKKKEQRKKDE